MKLLLEKYILKVKFIRKDGQQKIQTKQLFADVLDLHHYHREKAWN